jgi:hypothetical protein
MNLFIKSLVPSIIATLPLRFQQGKMPYVFLFALLVVGVLLSYAVVSPYPYASVIFSLFAAVMLVLLAVVVWGFFYGGLATLAGVLADIRAQVTALEVMTCK